MNVSVTSAAERASHRFFIFAAIFCVLVAFGGFVPTYWSKVATGTFAGHAILHVHGALMFTWTLYFALQTAFAATGRIASHRSWGLAGISLATAMAISIPLAAINSMNVGDAGGYGDHARHFAIVTLSADVLFAAFMIVAISNLRSPEVHKRWMLMATLPLLGAAFGRIIPLLLGFDGSHGPPPVDVTLPARLLPELVIVAGMVVDWRTRGRVHSAYLIGLPIILLVEFAMGPISASAGWMAIASWVQSLPG